MQKKKISIRTEILCLLFTSAALKLKPPILWCWPYNQWRMAVEVENSYQYPITYCCHATDNSKRAAWHNDMWHGSVDETTVCHWILPCGKDGTQWHSSTLGEHLWRPEHIMWAQWGNGWCVSAVHETRETATWKTTVFRMAMHSCHNMKWRAPELAHSHKLANDGDYSEK